MSLKLALYVKIPNQYPLSNTNANLVANAKSKVKGSKRNSNYQPKIMNDKRFTKASQYLKKDREMMSQKHEIVRNMLIQS